MSYHRDMMDEMWERVAQEANQARLSPVRKDYQPAAKEPFRRLHPFSDRCRVAVSQCYMGFLADNWDADTLTTVVYNINKVSTYGVWKTKHMHLLSSPGECKAQIIRRVIEHTPVGVTETLGITSEALIGHIPYHFVMLDIDMDKTIFTSRTTEGKRRQELRTALQPIADMFSVSFGVFQSNPTTKNVHVLSNRAVEWKDYEFIVEYMKRNSMIDPGYAFHTLARHGGVLRISEKNNTVPVKIMEVVPSRGMKPNDSLDNW